MTGAVLIDTGPLVAILSSSDARHQECVEALRRLRGRLFTCWPVLTEAAWLLRAYPTAIGRLLSSCDAGPFELLDLHASDLRAIAALLTRYRSLGIQLADAALVHLAAREGLDTIFTLDRRDFTVVRPGPQRRFQIIP